MVMCAPRFPTVSCVSHLCMLYTQSFARYSNYTTLSIIWPVSYWLLVLYFVLENLLLDLLTTIVKKEALTISAVNGELTLSSLYTTRTLRDIL